MKRALVLGFGIAVAVVFSDSVLYRALVVPRLVERHSVPLFWWALVESPAMIAIIVVGSVTRGVNDILWSSAAATMPIIAYAAWAGQHGQPGHLKSLTTESPGAFWLVIPAVAMIGFAVLLSTVFWLANVFRRGRTAG